MTAPPQGTGRQVACRVLDRLIGQALALEWNQPVATHPQSLDSDPTVLAQVIVDAGLEGLLLRYRTELSLPQAVVDLLTPGHQSRLSNQLAVAADSLRATRLFDQFNTRYLVFKGWPLTVLTGAQEEGRLSGDVDVLVDPTDVHTVHQALLTRGATPLYAIGPRTLVGWRYLTYRNKELPYRLGPLEIDVHWRVATEPSLMPRASELLDRSITVASGQHHIRTLSPTDALAATAFHFYTDYCRSPRRLVDLLRLLKISDQASFELLPNPARQAIADVLAVATQLFGVSPPHDITLPTAEPANVDVMMNLYTKGHWPTPDTVATRSQNRFGRNLQHLGRYTPWSRLLPRLMARASLWFPRTVDRPQPIGLIHAAAWQIGRLVRGKTESHI